MTQVARELAHLCIKHIAAYSPEARGRLESAFRTIQGRLPKDLALPRIVDDIAAANRFLCEVFVPIYNRVFALKPKLEESAFVPAGDVAWRDVLCVEERAAVANPVASIAPAFCPGHGAGERVPEPCAGDLSWPTPLGALDGDGRGRASDRETIAAGTA